MKQVKAPPNEPTATRSITTNRYFNSEICNFLVDKIRPKLKGSKILWYKNAIKSENIGGRGSFWENGFFLLSIGFFSGFLPPEKSGNAESQSVFNVILEKCLANPCMFIIVFLIPGGVSRMILLVRRRRGTSCQPPTANYPWPTLKVSGHKFNSPGGLMKEIYLSQIY